MMSTSDSNCKDGSSTKSNNNNDVCDVNNKLQNLSIGVALSVCANCGKEGSDINNICNKCKVTTYCNASCKKKHRHKHKKECEEHVRLATEKAAELHDEELFKQPPPADDCPICFLRMPTLNTGRRYKSCCGKELCSGCAYAPVYDDQGNEVDNEKQNECAFCRVLAPKTEKETSKRLDDRIKAGDAIAIINQGCYYVRGTNGVKQDYKKALELFHRAGKLGLNSAYYCIAHIYQEGRGVKVDVKKANYYYELAAMSGYAAARHYLGLLEADAGNMDRALKHYMIGVRGGYSKSLKKIQELYSKGYVTKEDYTKALQLYQTYLSEIKSDQRDEAAAADEENRYYESGV